MFAGRLIKCQVFLGSQSPMVTWNYFPTCLNKREFTSFLAHSRLEEQQAQTRHTRCKLSPSPPERADGSELHVCGTEALWKPLRNWLPDLGKPLMNSSAKCWFIEVRPCTRQPGREFISMLHPEMLRGGSLSSARPRPGLF